MLSELLEGKLKRRKLANGIDKQTGFSTMINQVTEQTESRSIKIVSLSGYGFQSIQETKVIDN